jgi:hypothetical protein
MAYYYDNDQDHSQGGGDGTANADDSAWDASVWGTGHQSSWNDERGAWAEEPWQEGQSYGDQSYGDQSFGPSSGYSVVEGSAADPYINRCDYEGPPAAFKGTPSGAPAIGAAARLRAAEGGVPVVDPYRSSYEYDGYAPSGGLVSSGGESGGGEAASRLRGAAAAAEHSFSLPQRPPRKDMTESDLAAAAAEAEERTVERLSSWPSSESAAAADEREALARLEARADSGVAVPSLATPAGGSGGEFRSDVADETPAGGVSVEWKDERPTLAVPQQDGQMDSSRASASPKGAPEDKRPDWTKRAEAARRNLKSDNETMAAARAGRPHGTHAGPPMAVLHAAMAARGGHAAGNLGQGHFRHGATREADKAAAKPFRSRDYEEVGNWLQQRRIKNLFFFVFFLCVCLRRCGWPCHRALSPAPPLRTSTARAASWTSRRRSAASSAAFRPRPR